MSNLRDEAIKLVEEIPEDKLKSVLDILQNVQELKSKETEIKKNEPVKKKVDWKKIIEKYSGSVDCFKGIDVEEYIRESRGHYDRV